jgi:hypothetical protein
MLTICNGSIGHIPITHCHRLVDDMPNCIYSVSTERYLVKRNPLTDRDGAKGRSTRTLDGTSSGKVQFKLGFSRYDLIGSDMGAAAESDIASRVREGGGDSGQEAKSGELHLSGNLSSGIPGKVG